jgi:rhamnosyltransferase
MTPASMRPRVSVIIPTRNGMPLIERCLNGVLSQQTPWQYELIVIDSASADGTWELVGSLPVRRTRIDPSEFNHGTTRNLGAAQAQGEYLVFTVQDAIPASEQWLANLVAALDRPCVAGAYSRQCPRSESRLITHYMAIGTTPVAPTREVKSLPEGRRLADFPPGEQLRLSLFQDGSSCIRRTVFERLPFGPVPYGEDIEWGKRAIEAGYTIVYEPSSAVYHSHDRSALYTLKRAYADHYQAAELFGYEMVPSIGWLLRYIAWQLHLAWPFILGAQRPLAERLRSALLAPVFLSALATGQYLGSRMYRWKVRRSWAVHVDRLLRIGV